MKNTIAIIAFLLIASASYAQYRPDFNDTTHIGNSATFYKVFTTDSCYYTVSYDTSIYFAKFDFSGNLQKIYATDLNLHLTLYHRYSNIIKHNNRFVVYSFLVDSNNLWFGYLAILNSNFDTIWTRTYHNKDVIPKANSHLYFQDIQFTPDGGYLLAGTSGSSNPKGFILKVSSTGIKQWVKEYPGVFYIQNIELTPDLGILIYGSEYNNQSIIKTTALGNIIWKKFIKWRYIWGDQGDLEYAGGDNYILLRAKVYGKQSSTSNLHSGVNLIGINHKTGTFLFDTIYRPFRDFPITGSIKLRILNNGKILVYGTAYDFEYAGPYNGSYCEKGAVVVYSPMGDSLTTHKFEIGTKHAREDALSDLKITPDGGFIGCGQHITLTYGKNHSYDSPWLFKYTPSWATNIANTENKKPTINCFPNPTDKYFNIKFDKTTEEEFTLTIYSITGSEIAQYRIPEGSKSYQLNLDNLAKGVYFYKLLGTNESSYSGKIIKY